MSACALDSVKVNGTREPLQRKGAAHTDDRGAPTLSAARHDDKTQPCSPERNERATQKMQNDVVVAPAVAQNLWLKCGS